VLLVGCHLTSIQSPCIEQDYGKHGIVDMDDKQKLFRLLKRLSTDPKKGQPPNRERAEPASRLGPHRGSRHGPGMDAAEARLKAQMLDGDAAVLNLADDTDDSLLTEVCVRISISKIVLLLPMKTRALFSDHRVIACSSLQECRLQNLPLGGMRTCTHACRCDDFHQRFVAYMQADGVPR
jgi:hypothetical protein